MLNEEAIKQLKVTELKAELQQRGLPVSGRKDELQARLLEAIQVEGDAGTVDSNNNATNPPLPVSPSSTVPHYKVTSPKMTLPVKTLPSSSHSEAVSPSSKPTGSSISVNNQEQERLTQRAARFNLPPSEEERRQQRTERFNSLSGEGGLEDCLAEERLRARQERFGVVTSSRLEHDEFETQKVKRLQRFGLSSQ